MKRVITIFMAICFFSQMFFVNEAMAVQTINVSGWDIEIQDDGTCALGKTYKYGDRDALIFVITSFGDISIMSDKKINGRITIDNNISIYPVLSLPPMLHWYSNSENIENGKRLIKLFKKGSTARVVMLDGQERSLSLKGFSKAYKRYAKCAR